MAHGEVCANPVGIIAAPSSAQSAESRRGVIPVNRTRRAATAPGRAGAIRVIRWFSDPGGRVHAEDDPDPLVRMAVSHYQFEAIHPFVDGNGRTGRVLNVLYLIEKDLLTLPILHLSRYIVQSKPDYYRRLLAVTRDEAWEDWILYMLRGVEQMWSHTIDSGAC